MPRRWLVGLFLSLAGGSFLLVAAPQMVSAANAPIDTPCNGSSQQSNTFFGIPAWYKYIGNWAEDGLGNCVPNPTIPDDLWGIVLAIVDMLLRVAGMVAVVFIIIAGVSFITSRGSPDKIVAARQRIINAVVGLLIAIVAAGVVQFIGNSLN